MQAITKRLKRGKRGISTVIVVMLSLVLVVIIVGNVVLWNYQMNQVDIDRMQETLSLTNVTRAASSSWVTAQSEYTVNIGTRLSGTYVDTQAIDSNYETFREETALSNNTFNPSGYILNGSTQKISGTVSDLTTDDSAYMIFRSYPSAVTAQTLFSHNETTTIAGYTYYQLKLSSADSSGVKEFQADAETTGRKLFANYTYPLAGIAAIPAGTWTIYYRAYTDHQNVDAYCNVDILVRMANGTIRTTIAAGVANSGSLTDSPTTVSGTYSWGGFGVADGTDYLEIDFYAVVTSDKKNKSVFLTVDDPSLPVSDQTQIVGVTLPSSHTIQLELTGTGAIQSGHTLMWTLNSAFTAANVTATLQLYNYNMSQYPTSGDGYLNYISSSTPNTDETKSQTITVNPTFYVNSTGAWKIRITAVKEAASAFDLTLDWVEIKAAASATYRLNIVNNYTINLQDYPQEHINGIEVRLRYNVSSTGEKWFMKAYNWAASAFSDAGFNTTGGSQPALGGWNEYVVTVTGNWADYVSAEGVVRIEFFDEGLNTNQTVVGIDFLGVRALMGGTLLEIKNSSPLTIHIVAIWITDATTHQRHSADLFLNSGEAAEHISMDVSLPQNAFVAKVVTERGNIAVFSGG